MQTTRLVKIRQSFSSVHLEEIPITSRQRHSFVDVASTFHSNVSVHDKNPDLSSQGKSPHASDFLQQNIGSKLFEVKHCVMDDVNIKNDLRFDDQKSESLKTSMNLLESKSFIETYSMHTNIQIDEPSRFLLHQACHLFPNNLDVVHSALILDESHLYKRVRMSARPYSTSGFHTIQKSKCESLSTLPLHIVIERKGSFDVLQNLARAAPEAIAWKDGSNDCNAISALLYQKRFDLNILSMFIRMNREALLVVDRLQNTSLHVACAQGAPIALVGMLYEVHPQALERRNMSGLTPLQISQKTGLCSLEVNDFLHDLSAYPLECNAHHLLEPTTAKRQKVLEL